MEPSGAISSLVGGRVTLTCLADANPEPAYQWVQRLNDQVVIKGNERVLSLENLIFEDDGEYTLFEAVKEHSRNLSERAFMCVLPLGVAGRT